MLRQYFTNIKPLLLTLDDKAVSAIVGFTILSITGAMDLFSDQSLEAPVVVQRLNAI